MNFQVKQVSTDWLKHWWKYRIVVWTVAILWLALICWLAFLWNLGNIGLVDETEPLFAEAARQMTVTGDWITPYFDGETRFDKPPLVYWLMAIAYQIIGVNEWAVRLPSAAAAIAITVLLFYTLRRFGVATPILGKPIQDDGRQKMRREHQMWLSAFIGSALMALNIETIAWGRTGVSDMLLSGCMGSALLAFFLGYASVDKSQMPPELNSGLAHRNLRAKVNTNQISSVLPFKSLLFTSPWYLAFYILMALAVLTKGPVGIVLPVLIITAFVLYLGNGREVWQEIKPLQGGLILLAIALPWYVLVTLANGEGYINSFFGYHNLERFTKVVNHHSAPSYFYFVVVLAGFAPWSIFLPSAIARLRFWQAKSWRRSARSTHLGLFALFWFVGVFGFFTIAVTKLPSYVLPLMPASAILVALLFSDHMSTDRGEQKGTQEEFASVGSPTSQHPSPLLWSGIFNVVFLSGVAVAVFYTPSLLDFLGYDPAMPRFPQILRNSGLPVVGGIIWGATAVGCGLAIARRQGRWLWSLNLVGFLAFLIFVLMPAYFVMDTTRQLPLRQLAALATQVQHPGEELIMIGFKKPSIVFYTKRRVTFLEKPAKAKNYLKAIAQANLNPPSNAGTSTLLHAYKGNMPSALILSQPQDLIPIGLQPHQYHNLGKAGAYQLIRFSKQAIAKLGGSS